MDALTHAETLLRDLRQSLRMIRTKPGFSIPALLSLSLGIGANIAIFAIVNAVLIRPLPYRQPDKLIAVYNSAVIQGETFRYMPLALSMYRVYEENAQTFQAFGVWSDGASTITGAGNPEQIPTVHMTHGLLPALGVQPFLGRAFSKDDESSSGAGTVILSYSYWQQKFAGDPQILGRTISIDFAPHQVIGVMPRDFRVPNATAASIFLPQPVPDNAMEDQDHSGIARLNPGVTVAQANQDMSRLLKIWSDRNGAQKWTEQIRLKPDLRTLKDDVVGDIGSVLRVLMGALVLVLMLVCANVANLALVRSQARKQEFAVRAALGATTKRIARELLIESAALGLLGGVLGLAAAYTALHLLTAHAFTTLPRLNEISLDATSIAFAIGCSLTCALFFGGLTAYKAVRAVRIDTTRTATSSARHMRAQNVLVIMQVALALVLSIAAGLMIRSFLALNAVAPGFIQPEKIETVRILIPEAQISERDRVTQMQIEIANHLKAIPGVTAAAFATALPLQPEYHNGNPVAVEGKTPAGQIPPNRVIKQISPDYFRTLGARLIAGRDFTWNEISGNTNVAILSNNMARAYWGEAQNALHKRIQPGGAGPWLEVIGVASDIRDDGLDRESPTIVYLPGIRRALSFAIRSNRAGTESFLREIGVAVHNVNPELALADVKTLEDLYRFSVARRSFALILLSIAGAMALTLAIIGVYGVLAYAVAQRRREMSIRIALGAQPATVKRLVVRQGFILASVGAC